MTGVEIKVSCCLWEPLTSQRDSARGKDFCRCYLLLDQLHTGPNKTPSPMKPMAPPMLSGPSSHLQRHSCTARTCQAVLQLPPSAPISVRASQSLSLRYSFTGAWSAPALVCAVQGSLTPAFGYQRYGRGATSPSAWGSRPARCVAAQLVAMGPRRDAAPRAGAGPARHVQGPKHRPSPHDPAPWINP